MEFTLKDSENKATEEVIVEFTKEELAEFYKKASRQHLIWKVDGLSVIKLIKKWTEMRKSGEHSVLRPLTRTSASKNDQRNSVFERLVWR